MTDTSVLRSLTQPRVAACAACALALLSACGVSLAAPAPEPTEKTTEVPAVSLAVVASDPAKSERGTNPLLGLSRPATDQGVFSGVVQERLRAGSYTYLLVAPSTGEPRWVVTLGAGRDTGTRVRVRSMGERSNFRSKRLNRTFDPLVFAIVSNLNQGEP